MGSYFRGQAIVLLIFGVLILGSCIKAMATRATTVPATATISTIDRLCTWVNKKDGTRVEKECGSSDEYQAEVYKDGKRTRSLEGRATVHLTYTAPQDRSYQTGAFDIDGGDDEFYELSAGDTVAIRVDKDNPAVFTRD